MYAYIIQMEIKIFNYYLYNTTIHYNKCTDTDTTLNSNNTHYMGLQYRDRRKEQITIGLFKQYVLRNI